MEGLVIYDRFIIITNLGSGNNGKVYFSYDIIENKFVAIKFQWYVVNMEVVVINEIANSNSRYLDKCIMTFTFYYRGLKEFDEGCNPNDIYPYYGFVHNIYWMSLEDLFNSNISDQLSINNVKMLLNVIIKGIKDLHNLNIIHSDLKLNNIMIQEDCTAYKYVKYLFLSSTVFDNIRGMINDSKNKFKYENNIKNICIDIDKRIDLTYANIKLKQKFISVYGKDIVVELESFLNNNNKFLTNDEINSLVRNIRPIRNINNNMVKIEKKSNRKYHSILQRRQQTINRELLSVTREKINELELIYNNKFDKMIENIIPLKEKSIDIFDSLPEKIKIIDFGNSFFDTNKNSYSCQPRYCKSIEILLAKDYNYSIDYWTIGCLAIEMLIEDLIIDCIDDIEDENEMNIHQIFIIHKLLDLNNTSICPPTINNNPIWNKGIKKYKLENFIKDEELLMIVKKCLSLDHLCRHKYI